jgi:hypothetical protein
MSDPALNGDRASIRGMDSNSLLRLYDRATQIFYHTTLQRERLEADKVIARIRQELDKRHVKF